MEHRAELEQKVIRKERPRPAGVPRSAQFHDETSLRPQHPVHLFRDRPKPGDIFVRGDIAIRLLPAQGKGRRGEGERHRRVGQPLEHIERIAVIRLAEARGVSRRQSRLRHGPLRSVLE